jgi:hypothetical protein
MPLRPSLFHALYIVSVAVATIGWVWLLITAVERLVG